MSTKQTIIVCGTEFSGTSLVAGTLRILGVPMGSNFSPDDTHQEVLFNTEGFDPKIITEINHRNIKHLVWGLKTVGAQHWLSQVDHLLINPVFIFCSRSLHGCLNSKSKYLKSKQTTMRRHGSELNFLSDYFSRNDADYLLLDFNAKPMDKLDAILEFIGIEPYFETYKKALSFNNGGTNYSVVN